jgi:tetratricopeptide (TPR) repeat protein
LGKIYKNNLLEEEKAVSAYKSFLELAPAADQIPEALYSLAILYLNTPSEHEYWKQKLTKEYPDAFFTRKLLKGTDKLNTQEESEASKKYAQAYNLYKEGNFGKSTEIITTILNDFPGSDIEDKCSFLKVLMLSKSGDKGEFLEQLQLFIKNYPSSKLVSLADEMKSNFSAVFQQDPIQEPKTP